MDIDDIEVTGLYFLFWHAPWADEERAPRNALYPSPDLFWNQEARDQAIARYQKSGIDTTNFFPVDFPLFTSGGPIDGMSQEDSIALLKFIRLWKQSKGVGQLLFYSMFAERLRLAHLREERQKKKEEHIPE